jgi:hypothetical protein
MSFARKAKAQLGMKRLTDCQWSAISISDAEAQRQMNTLTNCQQERAISLVSNAPIWLKIHGLTACERMGDIFSQYGLSTMVDRSTHSLLTIQQCCRLISLKGNRESIHAHPDNKSAIALMRKEEGRQRMIRFTSCQQTDDFFGQWLKVGRGSIYWPPVERSSIALVRNPWSWQRIGTLTRCEQCEMTSISMVRAQRTIDTLTYCKQYTDRSVWLKLKRRWTHSRPANSVQRHQSAWLELEGRSTHSQKQLLFPVIHHHFRDFLESDGFEIW